jgi:hypothetical protein
MRSGTEPRRGEIRRNLSDGRGILASVPELEANMNIEGLFERARRMTQFRHTHVDERGHEHTEQFRLDTTSPEEAERRAAAATRAGEAGAWKAAAEFLRRWGGEMRRAEAAGRAALDAASRNDFPKAFRKAAEAERIERAYGGVAWTTLREAFDSTFADAQSFVRKRLGVVPIRTSTGHVVHVTPELADRPPREVTALADALHRDCPICRAEEETGWN